MMKITDTVKHLIILNIVFYIGSQIVGGPAYQYLAEYFPENPNFRFWQPLTHMFMHSPLRQGPGITHILFNMFGLWMFGSPLEHFWGGRKFLFFYISCGIGASFLNYGIDYMVFQHSIQPLLDSGIARSEVISTLSDGNINTRWQELMTPLQLTNMTQIFMGQAYGASGALYGVMVAFAFMFPNTEMFMMFLPIPIKAKYFVAGTLVLDLIGGLQGVAVLGQGDGVGHFAHLGGAAVGFAMMWYWRNNRFKHNRWN